MEQKPKRVHADTWRERQESLKGLPYVDYLKSQEWLNIKRVARTRPHYQKCFLCGTTQRLEIHHRNYKWLGTKDAMRNLIALCRDCHQSVHDIARKQDITVAYASRKIRKEIMKKKKLNTMSLFVE
jgi:5-methylcytosine-specific restriction endonuclease McrA